MWRATGSGCQASRLCDTGVAFLRRQVAAALADELAGAPAAGQVVGGGFGAQLAALAVTPRLLEAPEELAVAVSRVDFDQSLARGVMLPAPQLHRDVGARWRVDPPRETVWDHQAVDVPFSQLFEELCGCGGVLAAVGRELAGWYAAGTVGYLVHLLDQPQEVRVLAQPQRTQPLGGLYGPQRAQTPHGAVGQRGDGPRRDVGVAQAAQDHVAMAEVGLRCSPCLGPLPPHECHEVRVLGCGLGVALANTLDRFAPARGRQAFRVIVHRVEVERRAVAGEVAGICGWMRALAGERGQSEDEGVDREGRVHVEIAEQHLLRAAFGFALRSEQLARCRVGVRSPGRGQGDGFRTAGPTLHHTHTSIAGVAGR